METKKSEWKIRVRNSHEGGEGGGNCFKQYIIVQFISTDRLKITEQNRRKLI